MSMYRVFYCVVGRGCLLWPVHFLDKTQLVFAMLHSVFQGQICLLLQVFLDFLLFCMVGTFKIYFLSNFQVYNTVFNHFRRVWLCATPWTVACKAPLSMEFPWQVEYWNGLPYHPPGDLPDSGIKPMASLSSSAFWADSLPLSQPESPYNTVLLTKVIMLYIRS